MMATLKIYRIYVFTNGEIFEINVLLHLTEIFINISFLKDVFIFTLKIYLAFVKEIIIVRYNIV